MVWPWCSSRFTNICHIKRLTKLYVDLIEFCSIFAFHLHSSYSLFFDQRNPFILSTRRNIFKRKYLASPFNKICIDGVVICQSETNKLYKLFSLCIPMKISSRSGILYHSKRIRNRFEK